MIPVNNPSHAVAEQTAAKNKLKQPRLSARGGSKPGKFKSAARAESPPGPNRQVQHVTPRPMVLDNDQINPRSIAGRRAGFGGIGPMITKVGYGAR